MLPHYEVENLLDLSPFTTWRWVWFSCAKKMGRAPCCSKVGLHRGPWTPREDALLTKYIQAHGEGQWRSLPKRAGHYIYITFSSSSSSSFIILLPSSSSISMFFICFSLFNILISNQHLPLSSLPFSPIFIIIIIITFLVLVIIVKLSLYNMFLIGMCLCKWHLSFFVTPLHLIVFILLNLNFFNDHI